MLLGATGRFHVFPELFRSQKLRVPDCELRCQQNCAGEYVHRYWSLYSDEPPGQSAGDAHQDWRVPSSHSKRKSVLANYSLPKQPKKAKTDADGQAQETAAAAADQATATRESSSEAGGAAGSQLPAPALPYSELYAISVISSNLFFLRRRGVVLNRAQQSQIYQRSSQHSQLTPVCCFE